jgi:aryl-alcohol dehydrogenase-like predicted oxidoreductase
MIAKRTLGQGLEVGALGLGCMTMTSIYGPADDEESIRTIRRAAELGATLIDTSDMYGNGKNEELLARALSGIRDQVVLATKFGNTRRDGKPDVDGRPEYARAACEASLKRLGVEVIDLYYQHRVDDKVPIEDTVGAMARLAEEGKVRFLGLSEAAPSTVRKAHATHPIAALQTEYSLWTREVEAEILPLCRELGIGFVPYSPLGRGFLTATLESTRDLAENDRRRDHPRFADDNFQRNLPLLVSLRKLASTHGATPAQIAIAWLLSRGDDIVPIPGTKHAGRLEENLGALEVTLAGDEIQELDRAFPPGITAGDRYPAAQLARVGL